MKAARDKDISYEVVRSRRSTADIVVERDGKIVVRAPTTLPDERIEDIVEAKRYWIYKTLGRVARPQRDSCVARISERRRVSYTLAVPIDLLLVDEAKRVGCVARWAILHAYVI